jgi:hypothetical protein
MKFGIQKYKVTYMYIWQIEIVKGIKFDK